MKHIFALTIFVNVCLQINPQVFNIQSIDKNKTPKGTFNDLMEVMKASERKDYIWVIVKSIDVFQSLHTNEPFLLRLFLEICRFLLARIHPIYLQVYPSKRPGNATINDQLVGALLNNSRVQSAASVFAKYEEPLFSNMFKFVM